MNIDPNTTIRNFIAALPSAAALLSRLGISTDARDERTLEQVCGEAGVPIEKIFNGLDAINWDSEPQ